MNAANSGSDNGSEDGSDNGSDNDGVGTDGSDNGGSNTGNDADGTESGGGSMGLDDLDVNANGPETDDESELLDSDLLAQTGVIWQSFSLEIFCYLQGIGSRELQCFQR